MNDLANSALFDALLAPLSPERPCGPDIDGDRTYGAIRHARRADDPHASLGDWEKAAPPKRSDWRLAEQLCISALCSESKDLNIAGWLCEAWIHLRALGGLADGLVLIDALLERYWDDLNPPLIGADVGCRTGSIDWLARNLPLALRTLPVAPGAAPSGRALTLGEWQAVQHAERQAASAAANAPRGRYTAPPPAPDQTLRVHVEQAADAAPADFYPALREQLDGAACALEQLGATLYRRFGRQAPSLAPVLEMLAAYQQALDELGGPGQLFELAPQEEPAAPAAPPPVGPGRVNARAPIDSRAEAYRRLAEVAEYLQRTEPHSPVPYLVRRAIGWGEMPLEELLHELLDSESDLKQIYRLLGTGAR